MTDKLFLTVKEYNMLVPGDTVTVAVSGGADSMCLLHLLKANEEKLQITVKAAHLNHSLRGDESDSDEKYVREYCENNGISLTVEKKDVNALKQKGEGIEEAARRIRYDFLQRVADSGKIATAHTLSDSAETVILNLTRGTTLSGLCGISPKRENIIRPLIRFTRQMTEDYCRQNGIEYVTDSTNLQDICRRNVIRHNVIPQLLEINPSLYDGILRLLETNIKEDGYLSKLSDELLDDAKTEGGYVCKTLCDANEVIRRRAIKKILRNNGVSPETVFIEAVEKVLLKGGIAQINPALCFRKRKGVLETYTPKEQVEYCEILSETVNLGKKKVQCRKISLENYIEELKVNKMLAKQSVDFDKIRSDAVLRSKKTGDQIKLQGRPTKSLKKLYNEYGILPEERNELLVLADSEKVCWLENFGADISARVSDTTRTVLVITVK